MIAMLFVSSCSSSMPPLARSQLYEVQKIATLNIPTYTEISIEDVKYMNYAKVSERDEYGRSLYMYIGKGICGEVNGTESYMIISQKCENEMVYYYPDVCYIANTSANCNFSTDEIELLKDRNDWGKPLEERKMSSAVISNNKSTLLGLPNNYGAHLKKAIDQSGLIDADTEYMFNLFSAYHDKSYLVLLGTHSYEEDNFSTFYLLSYNLQENTITLIKIVDSPLNMQDIIVEIKNAT